MHKCSHASVGLARACSGSPQLSALDSCFENNTLLVLGFVNLIASMRDKCLLFLRTFGLPSPLGIVVQPAATHLLTMVLNTRKRAHIIITARMCVWSCSTVVGQYLLHLASFPGHFSPPMWPGNVQFFDQIRTVLLFQKQG